jgi:hypothetical protein
MPVFNNILAGASGQAGGAAAGYEIERSVRFNSSDSAYLSKNISGSDSTFTISCWIKLGNIDSSATLQALFSVGTATYGDTLFILSDGRVSLYNGSSTGHTYAAGRLRDPSAWYHVHVKVTSGVPVLYINSEQFNVTTGYTWDLGGSNCFIGAFNNGGSPAFYWNGLIADFHCVSNQALDPTDFGEFDDNGVWQPIEYAGTYGTNGFHLPFSDNSTLTAIGADSSGNGNDWTTNNISISGTNTYVTAGTNTASSGSVPNGGTPYWVDILPTNADLNFEAPSFDTLFDGFLPADTGSSQIVYWTGDQYSTGNVTRARFSLRDFPTVTSVRIWGGKYQTLSNTYTIRLLDSSKSVISGTSTSFSNTTAALSWLTVPVSGTPAYIEFTVPSGSLYRLILGAIEVNGTVLLNNTGADNDSLRDSPTNGDTADDTGLGGELAGNYCTWNPLDTHSDGSGVYTLTNGNLEVVNNINAYGTVPGTIFVDSGKWYWEISFNGTPDVYDYVGIQADNTTSRSFPGNFVGGYWYRQTGDKTSNADGFGGVPYATSWSTAGTDIIGVALDADNKTLAFYKNGVSLGVAFTGLSSTSKWAPAVGDYANAVSTNFILNAGQRAFAYSAPSGFKCLCTANLDTPTIEDGSTAMDVVTYTGNGTSQTVTLPGSEFEPDLVWYKYRAGAAGGSHLWFDQIRGVGEALVSNSTAAEQTIATALTAFTASGFTVGNHSASNYLNDQYVAWCWDAGSSTVTNTDGSITSQVRASASSGFSIVTYTTDTSSANQTIGHGLGAQPKLIIIKARNQAYNWDIYHAGISNAKDGRLIFTTAAFSTANAPFGTVDPTSSVFTMYQTSYGNNVDCVAYCFAPVEGYSAFGSYTGNGSTDGPFIYTGFRPRWVMIKCTNTTGSWILFDALRPGYNVITHTLTANSANAEVTSNPWLDFVSNGLKLRLNSVGTNGSGNTYIYAAFAENPFKYARAR